MAVNTFVAISIGSYELEMKVFEISAKNGIREVDRIAHVIELGRDTYNNEKISFEMIDRLCDILYDFSRIMKGYKAKAYRVCATSAIREAINSKNVLDRIKVRTGLDVDVLSNSEQRFLSYKAFAMWEHGQQDIIDDSDGMLLVDIGAGSAQITLFDKGELVTTQNIRLGVLRIRELLARLAGNADGYRNILLEYIDNDLETFTKIFLQGHTITDIIGIGENLSYVHIADSNKKYLTKKEFRRIFDDLILNSEEELAERLDVAQVNASLIVPSLMLFMRLFAFTDAQRLRTPDIKLCDGMAVDYAQMKHQIKLVHDFDDDILSATRRIASRYQCNEKHTGFVENTALAIFDNMKKIHGLGRRDRLILQLASILHDIGKYVSLMYPSEAAYNIIITTEIIGLSHEERMTVARIVKYNTMDLDYGDVDLTESKLIAILRLSNALDRSHKQKMQDIRIVLEDNTLNLLTGTYEDITLEHGLLKEKADLFGEIYGVKPVLRQRKA